MGIKQGERGGNMRKNLDKIGPLGTVLTALCCIGTPGLLTLLSAVGAGFLINDAILLPLLVLFLAVSMAGLYSSFRSHKNLLPVIWGGASSFLILFFAYGWFLKPLVYLGLAGLIGASASNILLKKRCESRTSV